VFAINGDGSLTPGPLVGTEPTPRGITFHPNGRTAYVTSAQHVSVYSVGAGGALTTLQDSVETGGSLLFGSAVAPNGRALYAADAVDDRLLTFRIGGDGTIQEVTHRVDIVQPKGVAVTPNGHFVYVTQGSPPDLEEDTVSAFAVRSDGTLNPLGSVPIGVTGSGATITPDGRFLYVACQDSNNLFGFSIGSNGRLTPLEPISVFDAVDHPEAMAVSPDGRHLYVGLVFSNQVRVFSIGTSGALSELLDSPFATSTWPVGVALTPDGSFLYVSNVGGTNAEEASPGLVSAFAVRADGGLDVLEREILSGGDTPATQSAAILTNQGPTAQFSVRLRPARRATAFDATASRDSDGFVAAYDWDFGDGTRLANGGPTPTHVYRKSGSFRVTLTVTDNENCSTHLIYTGQIAYCNGSAVAIRQRVLEIPPR
jgi:6-phosphogluconolactonase (cycloisomerase 2 family)